MSIVNEYNGYTDDGSDESNFEAFDDESPLMVNNGEKLHVTSDGIKYSGDKVSHTSEVGEFDNRRFFR